MPTKVVSKPAALPELPAGHVLGKWTLGKRLGAGGFGYVHEATHPALPGQVFALKVAVLKEASRGSKPAKDTHGAVMIHKEVNTYRNVVGRHASRHFARLAPRDAYEENAQYRWLVMDKLGDSLAQKAANKKVPFSTVANIGLQVIDALEIVHKESYIFVDVSPGNMLLGAPGTPGENIVHLVDFGLLDRPRLMPGTVTATTPNGSPYFSSTGYAEGRKMTAHNDMESLLFVLAILMGADAALPWTKEKEDEQILQAKAEVFGLGAAGAAKKYTLTQFLNAVRTASADVTSKAQFAVFEKFAEEVTAQRESGRALNYDALRKLLEPHATRIGEPLQFDGPKAALAPTAKRGTRAAAAGAGVRAQGKESVEPVEKESSAGVTGVKRKRPAAAPATAPAADAATAAAVADVVADEEEVPRASKRRQKAAAVTEDATSMEDALSEPADAGAGVSGKVGKPKRTTANKAATNKRTAASAASEPANHNTTTAAAAAVTAATSAAEADTLPPTAARAAPAVSTKGKARATRKSTGVPTPGVEPASPSEPVVPAAAPAITTGTKRKAPAARAPVARASTSASAPASTTTPVKLPAADDATVLPSPSLRAAGGKAQQASTGKRVTKDSKPAAETAARPAAPRRSARAAA